MSSKKKSLFCRSEFKDQCCHREKEAREAETSMIKDPIFSTLKKSSKSLRPAAGNQGQLVLQLLQLLWSRSLPASSPAVAPQ